MHALKFVAARSRQDKDLSEYKKEIQALRAQLQQGHVLIARLTEQISLSSDSECEDQTRPSEPSPGSRRASVPSTNSKRSPFLSVASSQNTQSSRASNLRASMSTDTRPVALAGDSATTTTASTQSSTQTPATPQRGRRMMSEIVVETKKSRAGKSLGWYFGTVDLEPFRLQHAKVRLKRELQSLNETLLAKQESLNQLVSERERNQGKWRMFKMEHDSIERLPEKIRKKYDAQERQRVRESMLELRAWLDNAIAKEKEVWVSMASIRSKLKETSGKLARLTNATKRSVRTVADGTPEPRPAQAAAAPRQSGATVGLSGRVSPESPAKPPPPTPPISSSRRGARNRAAADGWQIVEPEKRDPRRLHLIDWGTYLFRSYDLTSENGGLVPLSSEEFRSVLMKKRAAYNELHKQYGMTQAEYDRAESHSAEPRTDRERLLGQIYVDVNRTYQNKPYFADDKNRFCLMDCLVVYASQPGYYYHQGMNELMAVVMLALASDYNVDQSLVAGRYRGLIALSSREHIGSDAFSLFMGLMRRVCVWFGVSEPQSDSHSGDPANRRTSSVELVSSSPVRDSVSASQLAEASGPAGAGASSDSKKESVDLKATLAPEAKSPAENGDTKPDIMKRFYYIHHRLLSFYDPELYRALNNLGIVPQLFLLRWFRVLFAREMSMDQVFIVWTELFKEGFELTNYVCVAMLQYIRDDIIHPRDPSMVLPSILDFPAIDKASKIAEHAKNMMQDKIYYPESVLRAPNLRRDRNSRSGLAQQLSLGIFSREDEPQEEYVYVQGATQSVSAVRKQLDRETREARFKRPARRTSTLTPQKPPKSKENGRHVKYQITVNGDGTLRREQRSCSDLQSLGKDAGGGGGAYVRRSNVCGHVLVHLGQRKYPSWLSLDMERNHLVLKLSAVHTNAKHISFERVRLPILEGSQGPDVPPPGSIVIAPTAADGQDEKLCIAVVLPTDTPTSRKKGRVYIYAEQLPAAKVWARALTKWVRLVRKRNGVR